MDELYAVVAEDENYIAYQNPYALSIAYQANDSVKDFSFTKINESGDEKAIYTSPFERLNKAVSAMLGEDTEIFVPIDIKNTNHSNARKTTIAGHTKYAVTTEGTEAYVTMNAVAPTTGHFFFHAPSEYPRETKLYINDDKFGDFMANESNRIKSIGKFSIGESINIKLTLAKENLYLKNDEYYLYYLNVTALKTAMEKLSQNQYQIENYSEDRLDGTITTSGENATIQTTIPYDEGWKVYVDGNPVEIYKTFDALIAFDIENEGAHTLKMVYSPTPITIGGVISGISLIVFIAICVVENQLKKKKSAYREIEADET